MTDPRRACLAPAAAAALLVMAPGHAVAQGRVADPPAELADVGVDERLGETIPMDVTFTDEQGRRITLGEYFDGGRPVLLTPVFYNCPMLCNLVLNGLVDGLNDVEWSAGEEFEIVTFSFNPAEEHRLAEVKKRAYLTQYHRDSAAGGWHFLVGDEANIRRLTEAIGFRFNPLPDGTIAHPASIVFLTPEGRISRYMNDVMFQPRDLRLALVESSEGTIGTPLEKFALFMCFQYDPQANSYTLAAWKLMRAGGALTLVILLGVIFILWARGPRNREADTPAEQIGLGRPAGGLQP